MIDSFLVVLFSYYVLDYTYLLRTSVDPMWDTDPSSAVDSVSWAS